MGFGTKAPKRVARMALAVGALALLAAACGSGGDDDAGSDGGKGSADKKVTLVYAGFGGALAEAETKAYFEPFMADNPNIKVVYDDGVDFAKLKAMVETGNVTWDVYTGDLYAPNPADFFEPIDCDVVPCDEIIEDTNVSEHMQVYYTHSTLITYDPTVVKDPPKDWADFFDTEKYPGKRAISGFSGGANGTMMAALLADGVAPEDLYPIDYDRALKKLDTIKDDIVWFETNAQCPQLLMDGEVTLGICLNGRVYNAVKEGADLELVWEENITGSGAISIVKGTKNLDAAQKLVAYILDKENNARLSDHIAYGPTNKNAFDKTNPDTSDFLVSSHPDVTTALYDWVFTRENGTEMGEKFDTWRQS